VLGSQIHQPYGFISNPLFLAITPPITAEARGFSAALSPFLPLLLVDKKEPDLFAVNDVRPKLLLPLITEEFAPTRRLSVVSAVAAQRSYLESLLPLCGEVKVCGISDLL
jgi:hypothetical protein